jgi:hypothetical protein
VHYLQLDSVTNGAFVEESTSWLQRRWRHERTITAVAPDQCELVDTVTVEPRVRLMSPFATPIVTFLFEHRHRRLRQRFRGAGC